MERKTGLLVFALAAMLALPASAAPPFGSFGGLVSGGNGTAGVAPIHGWALDDDGIFAVDILVDGRVVGRALYGRSRPGVTQLYPGFPDSDLPGFGYELDTTRFLNGLHTVSARVTSTTGEVVHLPGRVLEFTNLSHNLVPFGKIDFPNANAELYGNCNLADPSRRYSVVQGYALDVGVEIGDQGVGYVELLLDGAVIRNSQLSCAFSQPKGGLSDCWGLPRLDVTRFYPGLSDAPHSGFRFVLDVGELIAAGGYVPGRHVITIRSGDIAGQVANIHEIPVTYAGLIEVTGWAIDAEGVSAVDIYVDGFFKGTAAYGFPRPGITSLHPSFPDSAAPGWQFFLDTTQLSDGEHHFQVVVRDITGREIIIGDRRFVVFNP